MAEEISKEELFGRVEGLRLLLQLQTLYFLSSLVVPGGVEIPKVVIESIKDDIERNKEVFRQTHPSDEAFHGFDVTLDSFDAAVRDFYKGLDEARSS
ncbi:MAG: hypothetical protein OXI58_00060 [Gemmatimonadota bacterium]|nr:hypothetical protein [Gemmatimonadota bacterium]